MDINESNKKKEQDFSQEVEAGEERILEEQVEREEALPGEQLDQEPEQIAEELKPGEEVPQEEKAEIVAQPEAPEAQEQPLETLPPERRIMALVEIARSKGFKEAETTAYEKFGARGLDDLHDYVAAQGLEDEFVK